MGNPTAGIILLVAAAALIAVGVTDKGKQILSIITSPSTGNSSSQPNSQVSGERYKNEPGVTDGPTMSGNFLPGAYAGYKGANKT